MTGCQAPPCLWFEEEALSMWGYPPTSLVSLEDSCAYKGALRQNVEDAFAASRAAKNLVHSLFKNLRILLPTERGLVAARVKNGECIEECEVEAVPGASYAIVTSAKRACFPGGSLF